MKHHRPLSDSYELSLVCLNSLYKRLQREPPAKRLQQNNQCTNYNGKHAASTRLRIVFDASSKASSDLASLNECLFTGPSLTPEITNVLIRFRAWKFDLVADVRKAFDQIQIDEKHRNFLRFIWPQVILSDNPKLLILRFHRIFGINSSPFLLNGTLDYHISN